MNGWELAVISFIGEMNRLKALEKTPDQSTTGEADQITPQINGSGIMCGRDLGIQADLSEQRNRWYGYGK